jgi:hypothetical protein
VTLSEYRDAHEVIEFRLLAGCVEPAPSPRWRGWQRHPYEGLVVREMRATVVGRPEDVRAVTERISVRLESEGGATVFERPLSILAVAEKTRDSETEERLQRLERMMNVLVEQDSPAGEALRRLGGAKIEFQSPTMLTRPALFNRGHGYVVVMNMTLHETLVLSGDVYVRILLFGISKHSVT